jgi:hypothetical protein
LLSLLRYLYWSFRLDRALSKSLSEDAARRAWGRREVARSARALWQMPGRLEKRAAANAALAIAIAYYSALRHKDMSESDARAWRARLLGSPEDQPQRTAPVTVPHSMIKLPARREPAPSAHARAIRAPANRPDNIAPLLEPVCELPFIDLSDRVIDSRDHAA